MALWYYYELSYFKKRHIIITHTNGSRDSREYSVHPRLWMCVCVSVCVCPHDKTEMAETKIAKLSAGLVHYESSPTN